MALKLFTIAVGAATAASVSSSSTPLSKSNNQNRLGQTTPRSLQDNSGNSYAYLDDLSGHSLQYSNCLRVKIPQENDDDAVEGNVNFYNGAYRAQYAVYATFHVCGDNSGNSNGGQCYDCDYATEYATEANEYLETALGHWENYCGACQQACGGGGDGNQNRNRRLEDNDAAQIDCDACSSSCSSFANANDDNVDETDYVECAEAFQENGLQLYYGPQCIDGRLAIGVFYDDECTIKTNYDGPALGYYKFDTVHDGCVDCDEENGAQTCQDMYGDSKHCFKGTDQRGGDDEMSVCSAVKKALTVIDYGGVKKRTHGADTFVKVIFGMLLVSAVGGFFFLAHTYYIRHRGEKGQPMLSSEDVHDENIDGDGPPPATPTLT